jgi:flagellum-specific peptidoglycan hydrolase FlgJ
MQRQRDQKRSRYADAAQREQKLTSQREQKRNRYATDPEYRERVKQAALDRYHSGRRNL